MRRPGRLAWLTHDLTHRGVTAWALAAVLLGFYLGLYLTAETREFLAWLGVVRAPDALRFPGPRAWALCALVGGLAALLRGHLQRREDGLDALDAAGRRESLALGARTAALTAATLYTARGFAAVLEPAEHHGRHLLPSPGASWPAWILAPTLALSLGGAAASVALAWPLRRDRGALLRRLSLTLSLAAVALLAVLYGTHLLDPASPLADEAPSLAAFGHRLYRSLDSKWGLYGLVYTLAVTAGGVFALGRYGHDRYQVARTLVVITVQATFGFSVPVLLGMFRQPEAYLSYLWPLKIEAFYPDQILRQPAPLILWSFFGSLVLVPALGVFFGKRWYCSWVCGCGGLANTAGEPWRHLSAKGEGAWRFERVAIHGVLVLAVVTTTLVALSALMGSASQGTGVWWPGHGPVQDFRFNPTRARAVITWAGRLRYYYGIAVVSVLSGAIGVGLYPLGGTRQWCRNFCPMAALLGLVQKFGRFRIRVKADMCISCGVCTEVCEMGIDVRAYAQANQSFTRASCVGCGMCAHACPRGVLQLEQRFAQAPQERSPLVQLRLRKDG